MKVAILGYGVEGKAAVDYWKGLGAEVEVRDTNTDLAVPDGVTSVLGSECMGKLDGFDLIVRSPSVKPWEIVSRAPVTSVTREFIGKCPARVIGVTGTKGKGTTSTLITKILEQAGKRVWLGGNIGRPPLEFLSKVKASDLVVLELSSYQLMDMDMSPHIGVCLLVEREHQDWHRSMREYVAAKGNLFWHQRPGDLAIYNPNNDYSTQIAQLSPGEHIPYMKAPGAEVKDGVVMIGGVSICRVDEIGLVGEHNWQNVCAAVTATWELVGRRPGIVRQAIMAFRGLPHRNERIGEVKGVAFVTDSYSTIPHATIAAIKSFAEPKVLILGGLDRGSGFDQLAQVVAAASVRRVVLIGETAGKIEAALNKAGFEDCVRGGETMDAIVRTAYAEAKPGDVVLLSPGCASFDMFENFTARGELFRKAVAELGDKA